MKYVFSDSSRKFITDNFRIFRLIQKIFFFFVGIGHIDYITKKERMIKMNKKAYEICSKAKVSNDFARHEVPLVQLTDIQKDIEKMERYKKSLIYEYVTGKKRVKGVE